MSIIKILQENKNYEFVCEGDYYCYNNNLTTLKGSPNYVTGYFDCEINKLITLEGAPKHVSGNFDCSKNNLKNLEGSPKYVGGDFWCSGNPDLTEEEIIKYYKSGAVKGNILSDYGVFE